jgi:hypothetical protein
MKKKMIADFVLLAALLATLVAAVACARFGLGRIYKEFNSLDHQVGIVLGVNAIVVLLCSAIFGRAIRSVKQSEMQSQRQRQKTEIYKVSMESLESHLIGQTQELAGLEKTLFLIGSATVLKEYRSLFTMLSKASPDESQCRTQINRVLLAMRRDCGLSTYGLENEDWSDLLRTATSIPRVHANVLPVQKRRLGISFEHGGV